MERQISIMIPDPNQERGLQLYKRFLTDRGWRAVTVSDNTLFGYRYLQDQMLGQGKGGVGSDLKRGIQGTKLADKGIKKEDWATQV